MTAQRMGMGVGVGRVLFGVLCLVAPKLILGPAGVSAEGAALWMIRAFGIRDIVLGGGAVVALSTDNGAKGWVAAGAVADSADALTACVFNKELGVAGTAATLSLAVPAAAMGWASAAGLEGEG